MKQYRITTDNIPQDSDEDACKTTNKGNYLRWHGLKCKLNII